VSKSYLQGRPRDAAPGKRPWRVRAYSPGPGFPRGRVVFKDAETGKLATRTPDDGQTLEQLFDLVERALGQNVTLARTSNARDLTALLDAALDALIAAYNGWNNFSVEGGPGGGARGRPGQRARGGGPQVRAHHRRVLLRESAWRVLERRADLPPPPRAPGQPRREPGPAGLDLQPAPIRHPAPAVGGAPGHPRAEADPTQRPGAHGLHPSIHRNPRASGVTSRHRIGAGFRRSARWRSAWRRARASTGSHLRECQCATHTAFTWHQWQAA
jgi:hypothetical protein